MLKRAREKAVEISGSGRALGCRVLAGLGELLDDHVALQAREMVDEQYAFEMVHLVLEADREQAVELLLCALAVAVEPAGADAIGAVDLGILVGDRQAAFLIGNVTSDVRGSRD